MYNVDEILARLQKGESLDTIGNELATMLNDAQAKYITIQKEEEAKAKAAAEKAQQEKIAAQRAATRLALLHEIVDAVAAYAEYTPYAGTVAKWADEVTTADIEELDKQLLALLQTIDMMSQLNFNIKASQKQAKNTSKTADDALADFIKMMGW